jgi:arylsulfatase A-like enzyme
MTGPLPNVVIILTDDQGWGDLGAHGNPWLRTPNLDRLHAEGPDVQRFYSCTVCAPTRASLMTGRYNYRTRAIDTYLGRAMMDPEEVTLAEILRRRGYRTGLFGKWHLGDNYPMRAMDKGFEEVLGHNGGGMCQPSDFEGNTYSDPMLWHNGKPERHSGYCTDIFGQAAVRFIEEHRGEPFFVYFATNAPHSPLQIGDEWADPYRRMGINDTFARVYGMIENIDHSVGKLLGKLDELGLAAGTIVVFMGDNGPCGSQSHKGEVRYNGGLRSIKGSVYEGGILVPCLVRWPGQFPAGLKIDRIAHMIDLVPTFAAACGAALPEGVKIDGVNLLPLLKGDVPQSRWPERSLFTQWHRGDVPERFRGCAVIGQRFKLVDGKELYDLVDDPAEQHDIAGRCPDIVKQMRREYEEWFDDVSSTRPDNYAPPRIHLGTAHESPVILSRQDWRVHGKDGWGDGDYGHWEVLVTQTGSYSVRVRFPEPDRPAVAHFRFNGLERQQSVSSGAGWSTFASVELPEGPGRVEAWLDVGGRRKAARYVHVGL